MRRFIAPLLLLLAAVPASAQSLQSELPDGQQAVMSVPDNRMTAEASAYFTQFDRGEKGYLTRLEFGQWLSTLRGDEPAGVIRSLHSGAPNQAAVRVLNNTSMAFHQADRSGDGQVTTADAEAFLASQATPNN